MGQAVVFPPACPGCQDDVKHNRGPTYRFQADAPATWNCLACQMQPSTYIGHTLVETCQWSGQHWQNMDSIGKTWTALANPDSICKSQNYHYVWMNFIVLMAGKFEDVHLAFQLIAILNHTTFGYFPPHLHTHGNWWQLESHSSVNNSIFPTISCPSSIV